MKLSIVTSILLCYGVVFADTSTVPSPSDQKQAWQNGVDSGNSMNSQGVGSIGFNGFSDINSGLNSLNTQLGSAIVDNSKQAVDSSGQANSSIKGQYNSASGDPNYLYNQGGAGIVRCKSQTDPACNAVTRYNDDSVQASFNQYNMGTSSYAYNYSVSPDPNNATCSIISSYEPINSQLKTCIAGRNTQNTCSTIISAKVSTYQCYTSGGGCNVYINNKDCTLTQAEKPWSCTYHYSVDMCAGGSYSGDWSCTTTPTSTPPAITKPDGYVGGKCGAGNQQIPGWGGCPWGSARETSKSCSQTVPATYACKEYSINDQCSPYK